MYPETLDPETLEALETLHDGASAFYKSERSAKREASLVTTPVTDTADNQNSTSEPGFSSFKKEPKRHKVSETRDSLNRTRRDSESRAEFIEGGRQVRRSLRYKHRAVASEVLGGMGFKIEGCGRHSRLGGNVPLKVDGGQAYFDGIVTCGSLSVCPQCAAKITMQRQSLNAEILGRVVAHREGGKARYTILFVTHTVRHKAKHSFEDVWGALQSIRRDTYSGNPWKLACDRFGYVGGFRVVETTHGARAGWHVHSHAVIILDNFKASKSPEEMADWLAGRWREQSKKYKGHKVLLARGTDVQILRLPDISPEEELRREEELKRLEEELNRLKQAEEELSQVEEELKKIEAEVKRIEEEVKRIEEEVDKFVEEARRIGTYMHKAGHVYLDDSDLEQQAYLDEQIYLGQQASLRQQATLRQQASLEMEIKDLAAREKSFLDDGEVVEVVNPKAHALSMEAVGAVFKKGRIKNRTAFEILADIAMFQEIFRGQPAPMRMRKKNLQDREIFREYAMGTKGKRLYQTMGDYKALALSLGVNVEKLDAEDEELAEQENNGGGQVLAELPRDVWRKVREPRLAPVVLNVAEKVDRNPYELYGLLAELGLPDRYMGPLIRICEELDAQDSEPVGDTPADVEELGQLQLPVTL